MFQSFGGEQMKQAKVLSSEELKRVMAICITMQNGKRNRLMLMLSHYAGMRVGEIASLRWADVLDKDLKPKTMFYLKAENTKAKEARQVHLNVKLQKELATYWAQLNRWKKLERPVIQSQKGGHFTPNSIFQEFFITQLSFSGFDLGFQLTQEVQTLPRNRRYWLLLRVNGEGKFGQMLHGMGLSMWNMPGSVNAM
ncbi:tyrosine-type recombinase/integrase [Ascidiaceihabitans sp.]|uniref:tyrosine-type recombinase/integrase n=1 Tax=Ascidiaceihabitans sp. TaxID=1872644 RepID=UPI003296ED43